MVKEKLSVSMRAACELAAKHGGKLVRFPGGFWAQPGWKGSAAQQWFGATTIQGLVSRGVATYSNWYESKTARFPIEVTVNTGERGEQDS